MYISKLKIQNFKCFENVEINFNSTFNLIIGENNAGKSTIYDALRLWKIAFSTSLNNDRDVDNDCFDKQQYFSISLQEIDFLRVANLKQLFYEGKYKNTITISIVLSSEDGKEVEIPIFFELPSEKTSLRFQVGLTTESNPTSHVRKEIENELKEVFGNVSNEDSFEKILYMAYINPIFQLVSHEPCFYDGYIKYNIETGRTKEIIRNILNEYLSNTNKHKLDEIQNDLNSIISNNHFGFESNFEKTNNPYISIQDSNTKIDIAQLGSGTINILSILTLLSYGESNNYQLSILLLDEPDSHLHSDLQNHLFSYLKRKSTEANKQLFVITHNHELINCADEVLFVENDKKECTDGVSTIESRQKRIINSIPKEKYYQIYKKISPEYHKMMLEIEARRNRVAKLENELKELYPNKVFVCEDKGGRTIWEHLLKTFDIKDVKVIPSNGCTNKEPLIVFKDKMKNKSNYKPKIFRNLDRDGYTDEQIEVIKEKAKDESWEIGILPVNEIENFALLATKSQDEVDTFLKENNLQEKLFEAFLGTAIDHLSQKEGFGKEFAISKWLDMKNRASSNIIKYMNGKELCKWMGINADSVLKNLKKEDLPEDLTNYLNIVKSYFEGD